MKAAIIDRFGEPEVFKMTDMPQPDIAPDEIMVQAVAGSVNPIDWKQRKGKHRFILGAPFPIILGYDVAGIVVKTGSAISHFKEGDRVCGVLRNKYGGGLAEFIKGRENYFTRVPEDIELSLTAALPLAGLTALQALRDKAELSPGKRVLIIGAAGGVGSFAVQIAEILGAKITAVSSTPHFDFLRKISNVELIDYQKQSVFALEQKYDIIFDTIGKYTFPECLKILKPGGIHVNTLPRPKILIYKFRSLFTRSKRAKTLLMKNSRADLEVLVSWVREGKLKIAIDKTFSLEEIAAAHKYIEEGHTEGKILIRY